MSASPEFQEQIVLRLLQAASDGQTVPAGGHVVEDEERLACWEAGLLPPSQRDEMLAHLARCPRCRSELAAMVRQGHLSFVQPDLEPECPARAFPTRRYPFWSWTLLAAAASLLLAVGLLTRPISRPRPPTAVQGIEPGSALAMRGKITDYGYLLDGQSATKGFVPSNSALEQERQQLLATLETDPANRIVRLAYGEVLLRLDQPRQAFEVFEEMVRADSGDLAARLGLGLAKFLGGQVAEALGHFQAVLAVDPDNIAAKLNAAACLARLGRTREAIQYWRELLLVINDPQLRFQIQQTLEVTTQSGSTVPP